MPGPHDDLLQRALTALNAQRPGEAERLAGEVLKANPCHGEALKIAGRAARLQGRAAEAIALLEPPRAQATMRSSTPSSPPRCIRPAAPSAPAA